MLFAQNERFCLALAQHVMAASCYNTYLRGHAQGAGQHGAALKQHRVDIGAGFSQRGPDFQTPGASYFQKFYIGTHLLSNSCARFNLANTIDPLLF